MAEVTSNDILKFSEPIEQVYSNVVDALLINMTKHFNSGASLSTQQWEIKKLSELGQLTKESIEIIASLTGQTPDMVMIALENIVAMATGDIEEDLKKGVAKGTVAAPQGENALASASVREALTAYQSQAKEKQNLVNTTMLAISIEV